MTVKYVGRGASNNKQGRSLVSRFVWSGNKEVQPTALDLTTGIFTVGSSLNAMGLNSGSLYNMFFVMHSWANKILPVEINPVTDYFVYILSDTTFQLSTTNASSGAIVSYPNASNTAVDVTKFHLEYATTNGITMDVTGLGLSDILARYDIRGRDRGGYPYIYLRGTGDEGTLDTNGSTIIDGRETMALNFDVRFKYNQETKTIWYWVEHAQSIQWGNVAGGTWSNSTVTGSSQTAQWRDYTNFKIINVRIQGISLANGSVVEIFDMKGAY